MRRNKSIAGSICRHWIYCQSEPRIQNQYFGLVELNFCIFMSILKYLLMILFCYWKHTYKYREINITGLSFKFDFRGRSVQFLKERTNYIFMTPIFSNEYWHWQPHIVQNWVSWVSSGIRVHYYIIWQAAGIYYICLAGKISLFDGTSTKKSYPKSC